MWYKIKQGRHRAYPLSLGIHTGKTSESYEVIFDDSCRYTLDEENQLDWNKLVGWSYGLHHQNSIRIAWRYNSESNKIEVALYIYDSGIRKEVIVGECKLGIKYKFNLNHWNNIIDLYIQNTEELERTYYNFIDSFMIPKWGYNLGLFFGGSCTQPNKTMKVWIKKLKQH